MVHLSPECKKALWVLISFCLSALQIDPLALDEIVQLLSSQIKPFFLLRIWKLGFVLSQESWCLRTAVFHGQTLELLLEFTGDYDLNQNFRAHIQTTEAMEWLSNYQLNLAEILGKPRISKLELGNSQPLDLSMALLFRAWRSR